MLSTDFVLLLEFVSKRKMTAFRNNNKTLSYRIFQSSYFCCKATKYRFQVKKLQNVWKLILSQSRYTPMAPVYVHLSACGSVPPGQDPNHAFYRQPHLGLLVCKAGTRTRWINKAILKAIYHTRIRSVVINFLGKSIRGGIKRNGSMCCNKLTLITSPHHKRLRRIRYLAIQIIFKFIVGPQIFKRICIICGYLSDIVLCLSLVYSINYSSSHIIYCRHGSVAFWWDGRFNCRGCVFCSAIN